MRLMLSSGALCAAIFLSYSTGAAQTLSLDLAAEAPEALAKAAREKGNAVQGAILFNRNTIACSKCHAAGKDLLGPDLSTIDKDATDAYLVESLLRPSAVIKEGFESVVVVTDAGMMITGRVVEQTPDRLVLDDPSENGRRITLMKRDLEIVQPSTISIMPDGLADELTDRQQFLDVVKYLMEIAEGGSTQAEERKPMERVETNVALGDDLQGMVLLGELSCLACHAGESLSEIVRTNRGPDLSDAGQRINPYYLERFIADPLNVKPGTAMPDMMTTLDARARQSAARSITHYLVSLGSREFRPRTPDRTAVPRGRELFHLVGCVACHSPRNHDGSERFPADFASGDSVQGDSTSRDSVPLGGVKEKYNTDGLTAFLKDPLAVRPSGRMPNMQLSHWEAHDIAHYLLQINNDQILDLRMEGPGREKGPVPAFMLSAEAQPIEPFRPFQLDPALAAKGERQFSELGCVQCHETGENLNRQTYLSLGHLRTDHGCLSGEPGNWPRYQLGESQREAIHAALARKSTKLTDEQRISLDLTTFNCVACHRRGQLGGVSPERNRYFVSDDHNLGEQGRIPPRLTGVGAKLQPKWIRDVLVNGRSIRPYMKTRMPQYGEENVARLIDLFGQVDRLPSVGFPTVVDQKTMRNLGVDLAGNKGMDCVACHMFKEKKPETMPAVDLVEMAQRLKKDWFYHYMVDPQQFSANTVMPSFWPGGRSIRNDILDGDTGQQIEALWQFLLDGRQAKTPRGLVHEPMELVVTDEAVMLRRAYRGIGKRGIGVGYPNRVNLAFDAEQMRLATIWKGKFIDPGGVWNGQGSGRVRPLGTDLITFPPGPELDDATQPWFAEEVHTAGGGETVYGGRPPHHRFKGYYLDAKRRPTFMYQFENVDVEDFVVDVYDPNSRKARIRRTLTLTAQTPRPNAVFRVASDEAIVAEDVAAEAGGTFLIGKTLRVRVDQKHQGQIVATPSGKQLRIPIDILEGKSTLVLEYIW